MLLANRELTANFVAVFLYFRCKKFTAFVIVPPLPLPSPTTPSQYKAENKFV